MFLRHKYSHVLATAVLILPAWGQVSVLENRYSGARNSVNTQETVLTTGNVNVNTFGKLFSLPVSGSMYAQPLYVPHVTIPGKGIHNVLYVCTMNDVVLAYDADVSSSTALWRVAFTNPSAGITPVPISDITKDSNIIGSVGIESTPVIDASTNTIYLVARTKENGKYYQRLHALDITTGAEKFGGPAVIQATVSGSAGTGGLLSFDPLRENQRSALALVNGVVLIAWAAHSGSFPYHGWVMGYRAGDLTQAPAVLCTSPDSGRAGIWQSGSGPVVDQNGFAYYFLGDGTLWDGIRNFGSSALKLNPAAGLSVADYFTPSDYSMLDADDLDLGASGPVSIPGTNLIAGGGKTGVMYLLSTDNLGQESQTDAGVAQEWTATTGEIHGVPVFWHSPSLGPLLYLWTGPDVLKAFHFNGATFDTTPVMMGSTPAGGGEPGAVLTVSSNGTTPNTGIVWATVPAKPAGEATVAGTLHAYDASNLSRELWNSQQDASRDSAGNLAKYVPPVVANGKVYLATFSNAVYVYGTIAAVPDFILKATPVQQTVKQGGSAAYTLQVSPLNGFKGKVSLQATQKPTGVSVALNPNSITASGKSTMTATVSAAAPLGTYPIRVLATSGSISHTIDASIVITK
jgi:hypothetical protein